MDDGLLNEICSGDDDSKHAETGTFVGASVPGSGVGGRVGRGGMASSPCDRHTTASSTKTRIVSTPPTGPLCSGRERRMKRDEFLLRVVTWERYSL